MTKEKDNLHHSQLTGESNYRSMRRVKASTKPTKVPMPVIKPVKNTGNDK